MLVGAGVVKTVAVHFSGGDEQEEGGRGGGDKKRHSDNSGSVGIEIM